MRVAEQRSPAASWTRGGLRPVTPQMAAAILGSAAAFNLLGNLGFHTLVARRSHVSGYGVTALFLSFGILAGVLSSGFQYAAARRVAQGGTTLGAEVRAVAPWIVLLLPLTAFVVLYRPIGSYIHVNDRAALLLAMAYMGVTIVQAVPLGLLTGSRHFRTLALTVFFGVTIRLVVFPLLTGSTQATVPALLASVASTAAAGGLAFLAVVRFGTGPRAGEPSGEASGGGGSAVPGPGRSGSTEGLAGAILGAGLWSTWILSMVFARHYLAHTEAGLFSVAHTAAGAILFMSAPIVTAYVPTIARSVRDARPVVVGLLLTLGISAVAVVGLVVLGRPVVAALYGGPYQPPLSMLAGLGISASLVACATFLLWSARSHHLRLVVHRRAFLVAVPLALLLEIVFGVVWHAGTTALALGPGLAVVAGMACGTAFDHLAGREEPAMSGPAVPAAPPSLEAAAEAVSGELEDAEEGSLGERVHHGGQPGP